MLYKYFFVPRVNSNIFILIFYLRTCGILHKWGYCTSPYTQGTPRLHQSISVVKKSQLHPFQINPGSIVPLGDRIFTPYPGSQLGGLFGQKYKQRTLIPRGSGNSIPPTMNPLTGRGSHKTSFRDYKLITFITLHKNQIHLLIHNYQIVRSSLVFL